MNGPDSLYGVQLVYSLVTPKTRICPLRELSTSVMVVVRRGKFTGKFVDFAKISKVHPATPPGPRWRGHKGNEYGQNASKQTHSSAQRVQQVDLVCRVIRGLFSAHGGCRFLQQTLSCAVNRRVPWCIAPTVASTSSLRPARYAIAFKQLSTMQTPHSYYLQTGPSFSGTPDSHMCRVSQHAWHKVVSKPHLPQRPSPLIQLPMQLDEAIIVNAEG
ncbi:hypothetical protein BDN70DRAFT_900326 [Pholiota conissans]|uniref:Uncharacterized protein n=1 Tax=Pholiota conissans TaxID=109636 RepID=A0A9P6CMV1_9AGAR|nr:hypothetical protein BDN70DRAFT_900326 [Pholiota conissans]